MGQPIHETGETMIGPGSKYAPMLYAVKKLKPGEVYVATKGVDFTCEPVSFQGVVYLLALSKGGGWRATTITLPGGKVAYAFYKSTDYMRPHLPGCPVIRSIKGTT